MVRLLLVSYGILDNPLIAPAFSGRATFRRANVCSCQVRLPVKDVYYRRSSQVSVRFLSFSWDATDDWEKRRSNGMNIHRHFKNETHPSMVQFHSFVITPSYVFILYAFSSSSPRGSSLTRRDTCRDSLPHLILVEVVEARGTPSFAARLRRHFLHQRCVSQDHITFVPLPISLLPTTPNPLIDSLTPSQHPHPHPLSSSWISGRRTLLVLYFFLGHPRQNAPLSLMTPDSPILVS